MDLTPAERQARAPIATAVATLDSQSTMGQAAEAVLQAIRDAGLTLVPTASIAVYGETNRAFHERNAEWGKVDPEAALDALDERYHDHLPYGTNCPLCGVEHAAIHPEALP